MRTSIQTKIVLLAAGTAAASLAATLGGAIFFESKMRDALTDHAAAEATSLLALATTRAAGDLSLAGHVARLAARAEVEGDQFLGVGEDLPSAGLWVFEGPAGRLVALEGTTSAASASAILDAAANVSGRTFVETEGFILLAVGRSDDGHRTAVVTIPLTTRGALLRSYIDMGDAELDASEGGALFVLDESGRVAASNERGVDVGTDRSGGPVFLAARDAPNGLLTLAHDGVPDADVRAYERHPPFGVVIASRVHLGGVLATLDALTSVVFAFAFLVALACGVAAYVVASRLTKPLLALKAKALAIEGGALATPTGIRTGDEVEDLADAFDRMVVALGAREREVRKAERLTTVGTLVAGIAHEINNPLAYVRMNTELLGLEMDDIFAREDVATASRVRLEDVREIVAANLGGLDRIANIARGLKDVGKSGGQSLAPQPTGPLVREAIELARPRAPSGVRLDSRLDAASIVPVSSGEMVQVILNLVLNALEAAPRDRGEVLVTTRDVAGGVEIDIEDNGPGIPAHVRAKLFTPFLTTKAHGTGLGLSIVHRIVRDHGGNVAFEDRPGGGTLARIELPGTPQAAQSDLASERRLPNH